MKDLGGKVAVVTGGAGGIGLAMGQRFGQEGMKVVLADSDAETLEQSAAQLEDEGFDVIGVPTDVRDYVQVEALRNRAIETFGAVHVVCNNAGIGAGAEGALWEHELIDWKWALDVNLWGIIHGINAFVPGMVAQGEGHVVNTSSNNGGIAPLPGSPQYAVTKAGVVTLTECLYSQLQGTGVGASVLFPGPHMMRTRLFESWQRRPEDVPKTKPRQTPYITFDEWADLMEKNGREIEYTPLEEVAGRVADGIKADRFWLLPESEKFDADIRRRADSMIQRANPTYMGEVL
ncbi:MAG: putative dehydrogenase [Acidimicrobiales bacterium]|nr:putative dehydrogenase [Acidimicrobiales bacterium]